MKILYLVFLLHLVQASLETIAYSQKTGHITLLGQHHPRVILTTEKEDTFLVCGLRMEEAGCIKIHLTDEFGNDIKSVYTTLPSASIPFACYSKLHKSHLLPLCSLGNLTTQKDEKKRKLEVLFLNVKPLFECDSYSSRFWISLTVMLLSTVVVLLWSANRS